MKVLVIPTWYPSGEDKLMGAYHKDFTEALNKNNIEADMLYISRQRLSKPFKYLFMKKKEIEKEKNYNVYHYKILNYGPISFDLAIKTYTNALYKAVKDYIKINGKPDILHAQVTLPAGYATYIVGQRLNIPVVITEHCGNLERFFKEPLNKYTNQLLNKVTYSCVSSYMQKVALKYMDKCYVLPNLVNIDNYQNYGKRKLDKTFNLVSLCALREGKKIDNIFKAIKEIKDIDIHLDVIGDGFYEKYYKDKCMELGMDDKVTFLGRKNKKEINEIFKGEHALVISSEIESFAIPGIEALATGIPVVSTKCLGPEEYIDESNGVLCEKNDVQSLKDAIIKLYNNYDKYDPSKLRESIVRFSEKEVAGKAYEIYKEAICKK